MRLSWTKLGMLYGLFCILATIVLVILGFGPAAAFLLVG